jgi:hypothetical protein
MAASIQPGIATVEAVERTHDAPIAGVGQSLARPGTGRLPKLWVARGARWRDSQRAVQVAALVRIAGQFW